MQENLRREAYARDVDASRLIFAPHLLSYPDHLARLRVADLFLDTWPYDAAKTASDALWAGLPVLILAGRSYAARMAGSLLNAIGLAGLVTNSAAAYEALALKLAAEPHHGLELRRKLERNNATMPLFDTERFRRHIEAAYLRMWEVHQRAKSRAALTSRCTLQHDEQKIHSKGGTCAMPACLTPVVLGGCAIRET
jgi:protein O-GlcNAc transferase